MNAIDTWNKLLFVSNYKEKLINASYIENNLLLIHSSIDIHIHTQNDDSNLLKELLHTGIFVYLVDSYTGIDDELHYTSYFTNKTLNTHIYIIINKALDYQSSTPIKDLLDERIT